ncbi:6-bladed beta-propeller [Nitrosopumilus ureiphilus]|uniref:6-bladed beta-propeller n=1 Tax=Nitrosopumilus ureiphilus TaxID=1470067 RepID=A0A7D5M458_9ARCH|nr:6-bladed beta-propeller [Nitrosopumilus ureiphilus]QLH06252.1 6-bladed beta-propeller [Nitrosopumilus ureiphilus]
MVFSIFLVSSALIPSSFALGNYDLISEWGQFGIAKPGHFSYPEFIAVDEQGNSYISDLGNKRIQKFSSDGQYITHWGQSGTLPGEFHYPSGIAVSSNFVFVADHDLHKIQKFYLNGTFADQWGSKGIHDGEFKYPNDIAVDSENFVYVVDTGNQRIQKFTSDGEFVLSFGTSGMGPGQFLTAIGIDVDDQGNVYVTDKGNRKIEKFDSDGSLIKSFPFRGLNYVFSPSGIEIDPNGTIYVINSDNGRILYLEQDIGLTLNIFEKNGPYPQMFSSPTDIALGINGELLVVDSAGHKIYSLETPFYVEPEISEVTEIIEVITPEMTEVFARDEINPTIMAPSDMILDATGLSTFVNIGEAIAADSESGIKAILNNAPEEFSLGVNKVTWIAFDYAGNTAETYQTITINACGHVYSDYHMIVGTADDDFIQGTAANDLIFGLDGADIISGNDGNDCIFGGNGDDVIYGNNGYDTIMGNSGNDVLKGGSGFDIIYSNSGSDVMDGGDDSDGCYSPVDSTTDLLINCES